jgi:hypothetical protein
MQAREMELNRATAIRRAVYADVPRIMTIRHAVRENRLSDPNAVTAADCVAFIDRAEMWVWVEDGLIQGFAGAIPATGTSSPCSSIPTARVGASVEHCFPLRARHFETPDTAWRG